MANLQANRTLSGSFAEVWVDGARIVVEACGKFVEAVKAFFPFNLFRVKDG